ncbi:MAG: serine/threonine protein kinase [Planctomycetes bacterium]|nr:serine/threonine protein kinase [Planctomycetota bacterium]MCB9869640.1 serine/threonine protein kinase [Planctomycetota bacterium]
MKICLECEGITESAQLHCSSCEAPLVATQAVHFPRRRGEEHAGHRLLRTVVDGKYRVLSVLGRGGMGTVFRAQHAVSHAPLALKILNPQFADRSDFRDYFLAEARRAGRVLHESVGRVLDVGETQDGTVYIAMELIEGATLDEYVHGPQPLPPAVVVEILVQICGGLAAAHDAQVVHRDLTPRNVMLVVRDGRPAVKILDFGIAGGEPRSDPRRLDGHEDIIAPGFANPPYTAPEQLIGGAVDARSDLYSLGVIAYEALTRRLPVDGDSNEAWADATVRGAIHPLLPSPGVPVRLTRLVDSLLAFDPARRPPSAQAVREVLEAIRRPQSRLLRDAALLVLFLAAVVLVLAYRVAPAPFLQVRHGPLVVVGPGEPLPALQYLHPDRLQQTRFDFSALRPEDLVVELSRNGVREHRFVEVGSAADDGTLQVRWEKLRPALDDAGPVLMTFLARNVRALGKAHVCVDGEPPRLELLDPGSSTLCSTSKLGFRAEDRALAALDLECRIGGELVKAVSLLGEPRRELPVEELLGDLQRGSSPLREVELRLTARDAAGNAARPEVRHFAALDCRVPGIVSLPKRRAFLLDSPRNERARLSLELSDTEPGLKWFVGAPDGPRHEVEHVEWIGMQAHLTLAASWFGGFDRARRYPLVVELRDAAGNRGSSSFELTFHTEEPELVLVSPEQVAHVLRVMGDQLVWSGGEVVFAFRCNPLFRPQQVSVHQGARLVVGLADLIGSESEFGGGKVALRMPRVAGPEDGRAVLHVVLHPDVPGTRDVTIEWPLRVMARRMQLRLPETNRVRYLNDLLAAGSGLFEPGDDGLGLQQPLRWQLSPPDARLLQGQVYWGHGGGDMAALDLAPRTTAEARFVPGRALTHLHGGTNLFALRLRDPFGRPVDVSCGGRPAEALGEAVLVARFEYHPDDARLDSQPLLLENQQPTRVRVHTPYTFRAGDLGGLLLWVGRSKVPCEAIRRIGDRGCELRFAVPFEVMVDAIGRRPGMPELAQEGHEFAVELRLETPAFQRAFGAVSAAGGAKRVAVRTIRSSLVQVRIGTRFPPAHPDLAGLELVPVLRPLEREFADPVPAELRRAGGFVRRREVAVKGVADFYLQSTELTAAQYRAIIERFFALPVAMRIPAQIVHPFDPLGVARIAPPGNALVPHAYGGDLAAFSAAAIRAPAEAVSGIDFFQAYAVARMAGQVLLGDPEALRLPFGVELELAALGPGRGRLNGVAGGPTLAELRRRGDSVRSARGELVGLDFGRREWVMDLPWPRDAAARNLVGVWMRDFELHQRLAAGEQAIEGLAAGEAAVLRTVGVVRGGDLTDAQRLVDLETGRPARPDAPLGRGVPGVTRVLCIDRDGSGIGGKTHRLLREVGMRLAGGRVFLEKVRAR